MADFQRQLGNFSIKAISPMNLATITASIAALCCFAFEGTATAADFRRLCDLEESKGMQCTIEMTGEIRSGDAKRLRAVLTADKSRVGDDRFLMLESPGGDIREALKIGDIVKSAMLITTLVRVADLEADRRITRRCVSACFLVFLAGSDRKVMWGQLGTHRPYFDRAMYRNHSPLQISQAQLELEDAVRRYVRAHGVSDQLIGRMMAHSSKDVYWLSDSEQAELEGEQSWFQEFMIATCKHDPRREAEIYKGWLSGAEKTTTDQYWLARTYDCINREIARAQRTLAR